MDTLQRLVALYNEPGWKDLEKWIKEQIESAVLDILNPATPTEQVANIRIFAFTYQTLLDKVEADKEQLKQMQQKAE